MALIVKASEKYWWEGGEEREAKLEHGYKSGGDYTSAKFYCPSQNTFET